MPSEKQFLERKENIISIIEFLRENGKKSRRDISKVLKLSWGCVSELITILQDKQIVLEEDAVSTGKKGRNPSLLTLNREICFLGIDINVMGLKASICNLYGEKLYCYEGSINITSKEKLIGSVLSFIDEIKNKYSEISGICFAMQGIYKPETDAWLFPGKEEFAIDFKEEISSKLDVPFIVEHDPDCILCGCFNTKFTTNKLLLRIDKGIGGVMMSGKSSLKESFMEAGYMVVNDSGERLQDVASISAIEKKIGKSLKEIDDMSDAKPYFEIAGRYIGMVLGNICNLFAIDELLLCGEMMEYYEEFGNFLEEHYKKTALPVRLADMHILHITDASFGAANLAMNRLVGILQ